MDFIDRANEYEEIERDTAILNITNKNKFNKKNITGICVDCEEFIDKKRLEALPFAVRCFKCQTEFERKLKR